MSAKTAYQQILGNTVINATGQVGFSFPTENADEVNVYFQVTTAPTAVVFGVEVSPDGGTTWFPHGTVTSSITTISNNLLKVTSNCGKMMRAVIVSITGSGAVIIWAGNKRTMG